MTAFLTALVHFSEKILVLLAAGCFLKQHQVPEPFKLLPLQHPTLDTQIPNLHFPPGTHTLSFSAGTQCRCPCPASMSKSKGGKSWKRGERETTFQFLQALPEKFLRPPYRSKSGQLSCSDQRWALLCMRGPLLEV